MSDWIDEELRTVDLGDERLDRRMGVLLERLGGAPQASIPAACRGHAETLAAYRFFDNERVSAEKVLAPHVAATVERIGAQSVALLVQDTTELDYTDQPATQGLGPLNYERRIGLLQHLTLAVTPERLCLGVIEARIWGRRESEARAEGEYKRLPIEKKESVRWIESYRVASSVARRAPQTRIVSVADREGDIYEFFEETEKARRGGSRWAEWIVRSNHDRRVETSDEREEEESLTRLRAALAAQPVLGRAETLVARKGDRPSRLARIEVRATRLVLQPPFRKERKLDALEVGVVWAHEVDGPKDERIDWLLLTSLPVETLDQALQVVDYYCCRWQIELFFRVLKSGCKVEKLQLENDRRLKTAIALYLIVAWRVLFVTMLGRACPDLPATAIFDEAEWKSVWTISRQTSPPETPPPLGEMVRMVAALGGWLGRKGDGEPGAGALWRGLQRTTDFAMAWVSFGPAKT